MMMIMITTVNNNDNNEDICIHITYHIYIYILHIKDTSHAQPPIWRLYDNPPGPFAQAPAPSSLPSTSPWPPSLVGPHVQVGKLMTPKIIP